jgi:peptidyl-prolyl cis-trans isomerase C
MQVQDVRSRLVERAKALGLEGDTEEAVLDALLEHEVQVPPPTLAECQRYYTEHPDRFRAGDLVEADHILFAVTGRVPLAALRERAQQVLDALLAEPDRFAALATEFSNCPSGKVGGNLGALSRDDVVPEFWQAIMDFGDTGVRPALVESRYGLHIVRVARRVEGRALPFEAVRQQIMDRLAERNLHRALREYAHALVHSEPGHTH